MCSPMSTRATNNLTALCKVDLEDLDEDECEKILEVIQRDYDMRTREKERIMRETERLEQEQYQSQILASKADFNENCCIRCCHKFGMIFKRKQTCVACKFHMCRTCTVPDRKTNADLCKVCFQQKEIASKSCNFFYSGEKQKFHKSGSAKFVKTLQKRRESEAGSICGSYDAGSICGSHDAGSICGSLGPIKRRPSLLNLLEQTEQLQEAPSSNVDVASMGQRPDWGVAQLPLPSQNFNAPLKQFETSVNTIIDDVHSLIQDYNMLDDTEVLDPEHFLFRKARRQIYVELLKLSQHISDAMVSDSDEDDDIMQQTNHMSAIRVRRYLVQKVEHITKTNLKHLLPDENDTVENWDTDSGKQFLEEQLVFVIVKKVLENFTRRSSSPRSYPGLVGSMKPVHKIVITEENCLDPAESYCSTLMPRTLSPESERRSHSSTSDCIQSDMTLPSFSSGSNRDVNLKIAHLMKGNSPLPSLETLKSPIGRLEMDLDDIASLQKFVYYSDDEPEWPELKHGDRFFEEKENKNFFLKVEGSEEYKVWVPAEAKIRYMKAPNVAMPHHVDRISPMVGDIIADELSDLSDPPSEHSDVAASDDEVEKRQNRDVPLTDSDEEWNTADVLDIPKRKRGSKTALEANFEPRGKVKVKATAKHSTETAPMVQQPVAEERNAQAPAEISSRQSVNETQEDSNTESTNEENDPKCLLVSKQSSVKRGDVLTLSCELTGTEPLDTFWYYEKDFESNLENDEKYEIRRTGNKHSLTIHYCDKDDAGEYLCIGVNAVGQCSRRFRVKITDNPLQFKVPEFLKKIEDVELNEGKSHKFSVRVIGQPPPRVIWYKDTELLIANEPYRIEKIGNRNYSLSLYSLSLEDDAEYSAVAINAAGRAICSAQMFVESKQ